MNYTMYRSKREQKESKKRAKRDQKGSQSEPIQCIDWNCNKMMQNELYNDYVKIAIRWCKMNYTMYMLKLQIFNLYIV